MKKLPWILVMILAVALAFSVHTNVRLTNYSNVYTDTTTFVDTIKYYKPVPKDSVVIKYKYVTIPTQSKDTAENKTETPEIQIVESTTDSTTISIPITQNKYENEEYCAWISGYNARLDSIFVFPRTTTITKIQNVKPGRWSFGIQAGIGVYGNKLSPYVGLGISYNLFTW